MCTFLNVVLPCLHLHVCTCIIAPTMVTEPFYLSQLHVGYTPLHLAVRGCHASCVESLLSTPGIDVNIKDKVNRSIEC